MLQTMEAHRDNFTISTDPARLDAEAIAEMLKRAYWAQGRPRERVISDYAIFAYLCDVFIHEDYRAQGLGRWLMQTIHSHPDLQGLRRWTLVTRDAHSLYTPFGWTGLKDPDSWMELLSPFPGEGRD